MTLRSLPLLPLLLLGAAPILVHAQETSGKEDERLQALTRRNVEEEREQWFGPRNKISVGFRVLSTAGRVDFNNLGAVPARTVADVSAGRVDRVYDNGTVYGDTPRSNELDSNGNQTSTPGGRYLTYSALSDGTKVQTGDYVSFTPGQTRHWSELTDEQLAKPGYVSFTNYSTTSEGGSLSDKPGVTGGVELQFAHLVGRMSRHIEWGFTTGVTLNGINSKTSGSVVSALNAHTDYYSIVGGSTLAGAPISGPTYNQLTDVNGTVLNEAGLETTTPLSQTADTSLTTNISTPGGATVNGRWQVKGAYFMVKLGPSFRTQFNDRLELSGSAGFAGAYAGSRYVATESFELASLPGVALGVTDPQISTATKFLTGFYADLTLEWNANETTGIFGGITAQQLSDYEQHLADRVARVDLGSAVGIRGGISIRF